MSLVTRRAVESVAVLTSSVRLWEWVVDREAGRATSGVSRERHRAMMALSQSLVAVGAPISGKVVPVALVDGAWGFAYLRMSPVHTADCVKGVIRWS